MLCHPEPHPAVNYALRNVKSQVTLWVRGNFYGILRWSFCGIFFSDPVWGQLSTREFSAFILFARDFCPRWVGNYRPGSFFLRSS